MSRRREHILGLAIALLLCAVLGWAHVALNGQPQAEAMRTVSLLSSDEMDMSGFYSSRFIGEVRSQTGVDSLADDALFERTLWFLLSNSVGFWPTVRQTGDGEVTWVFNTIAPVNRMVSVRSVRANGHLIFDHVEGLEELMLAKPDLWTEHLQSGANAER